MKYMGALGLVDWVGRAPWRGRPIGDDVGQAFAILDRGAIGLATIRNLRFRAVPAPER